MQIVKQFEIQEEEKKKSFEKRITVILRDHISHRTAKNWPNILAHIRFFSVRRIYTLFKAFMVAYEGKKLLNLPVNVIFLLNSVLNAKCFEFEWK